MNWLLVLDSKVALVQKVERFFIVLVCIHRLVLFGNSVDFLDSSVKLICYLCGTVVPQLPILHLYPDWPEAESEVL